MVFDLNCPGVGSISIRGPKLVSWHSAVLFSATKHAISKIGNAWETKFLNTRFPLDLLNKKIYISIHNLPHLIFLSIVGYVFFTF